MIDIEKEREAFEAHFPAPSKIYANQLENQIAWKEWHDKLEGWQARAKQHSGDAIGFVSASEIKDMKEGLDSSAYLHAHADEKYTIPVFLNAQQSQDAKDAERLRQFEKWADDGLCPVLAFNDNGYWAVTFDSFGGCDLSEPPNEASFVVNVEKSAWKETVQEAIDQAIASAPTKG